MTGNEDTLHAGLVDTLDERTLLTRLDAMIEGPMEGSLEVATECLAHASARVRRKAARVLAATRSPRAVEPLKTLLSPHQERETIREAVTALLTLGGKAVTKVLQAVLENQNDPAHSPLLEVLSGREGPAGLVGSLKELLFAPRYPFKERVLVALGSFRGPRVEALFQEYLDEADEDLASAAARGLARFATPENYRRLADRLVRGPWTVQVACLEAMTAIEARPAPRDLAPALTCEHPEVVLRALDVLARRMGAEALPLARNLVRATSWKVRQRVAEVLGRTADPRVRIDLETLSGDERGAVRAAAFAHSTGIPGVDHEAWGDRAATDREAQVRRAAAGHLAEAATIAARTRLLSLLKDKDGDVRLSALQALQGFDLSGLADSIKPLAQDAEPEVRTLARDTLVRIGEPSDRVHLDRALELVDAGEWTEAQALLRRLAVDRPTDPKVLYELARVCRRVDAPGEAEVYLRKVVDERPEHMGARKHLAEVLLEMGRRAEAAEHLQKACAGDPGNWKLWVNYGEVLLGQEHFRAAVGAFEKALEIHHGYRPAHRGLARAYEACGDLEGALREWTYLHERDPGRAAPLAEMGRIALDMKHFDDAATWLARARDLGERSATLLDHLADALEALGCDDQALTTREEAVAATGGGLERRLKLARLYLRRADPARALALTRALREEVLEPDPEVLDLEADALADMGECEGALDTRIQLLGVAPDHPGARSAYARLLGRMGRAEQARKAFEEHLEADPLDRQARKALVDLEVGAGKIGAALRHLEKGMELHTLDAGFRYEAAVLHRKRGETERALRRALEAVELEPELPHYRILLGDLHREHGSPKAARAEYTRALEAGHEDPRVRYLVGRSLLEEDQPAKALVHLTRAESGDFVENPDLHRALGECHLRLGRHARARPYLAKAASLGEDAGAYLRLAELELEVGNLPDALGHLRTVERLTPDEERLPLLEGRCRRRMGEVGMALERFKKALQTRPGDPSLVAEIGACYLELGSWRELTALHPGSPLLPGRDPDVRVAKGTAHLRLGNHAKAAALAEEMLELDADLIEARALLAAARRVGGDLAGAETAANAGLRQCPDHAGLLEERARIHLEKRYYDAAVADCHHGLGLEERREAFYWLQAKAFQGLGRLEKALEQLGHYLLRCPRDAAGHLAMAEVLEGLARRDEACEAYRNALALDPSLEDAYVRLAELEIQLARTEDAVATLKGYLEVSKARSPALTRLAELHQQQGDLDGAVEALDQLIRVEDGEEARLQLLRLLLKRRDMGRAWPLLERSASLWPEIPRRLGEEVLQDGDPGLAKDLLVFALSVSPRDVEALHQLSVCHYRLGSYDAAQRTLARLLDARPTHAGGHFYMGLIQLIRKAPRAAEDHFLTAVEGAPENVVCYRHLASLSLGDGRAAESRGWARAGLERDPGDRELRLLLAAACEQAGELEEALEAYTAAGEPHADSRSHLPAMRLALRTGQPRVARELGEAYVDRRPEDATGKRLLARAAAADGDPARAGEVLEELRSAGEAGPHDLRTLARAYAATERWEAAGHVCEEILAMAPEDGDTWNLLGHVENRRGRWGEASRAFGEAARLRPQWADSWRALAEAYLEQARVREAEEPAEKAIALQSGDPRNHRTMGRVQRALGRLRAARDSLETALRTGPAGDFSASVRLELAQVLRELGEPGNAKKILETVPGSTGREAARQILEIAFEAQDYPAACHHAKGFLSRYPEEPGVLEILGRSLVEMGMDRRARTCFDRHMTLFGTPVGLAADLARARLGKGQAGEAVQVLVHALEKAPRSPELWEVMGEARAAKGDPAGSLAALERAVDLDPSRVEVARGLGRRYVRAQSWEKARALYREALKAHPYDAEFLLGLGRALRGQGEHEEALRAFLKAAEADPRSGEAQRELGLALARAGHRPRAVEALQRAVRLDGEDLEALSALARAHRDLGNEAEADLHFERLLQVAPARSPEAKAARAWLHRDARKAA